jgi:hypothetical protein
LSLSIGPVIFFSDHFVLQSIEEGQKIAAIEKKLPLKKTLQLIRIRRRAEFLFCPESAKLKMAPFDQFLFFPPILSKTFS